MLSELKIDVKQFGHAGQHVSNIKSAMARGLPELAPAITSHDGTIVLVGSGPSVVNFLDDLREERKKGRPIIAINGAHDWLCDNNLTPELFLTVDPRPMPHNLTKRNDDTIYLLASRVATETLDLLKDHKVMLWHSWSDDGETEAFSGKLAIGGGTTSGLRAINVGYIMGFRKFVLYGMDSCLAEDRQTKRFTGGKVGFVIDVVVGNKDGIEGVDKRTFYCNYAMAQQAKDFQFVYKSMPDIKIESKGDGLIAAIIAERKKTGRMA